MNRRKRVLVITGVPGTGKTSFSNSLMKRLNDAEVVHTTEVVNGKKLFSSRSKDGAKIVKMKELKKELDRMIAKSPKRNVILEGHLLCDMKISNAKVLVLREHLTALSRRLEKRGYSRGKIKDNIVSEATDYCGIHAENNYGSVFEAFSSDKQLMSKAMRLLDGKKAKNGQIDLLPEFDKMLRSNSKLAL